MGMVAIPLSSANATDPVPVVANIRKRYVAGKNVIVGAGGGRCKVNLFDPVLEGRLVQLVERLN